MKDLDQHVLIMTEVMTPEKANFAGNIHGGHLLRLMDQVAYACAAKYSHRYVMTLSVNKVLFKINCASLRRTPCISHNHLHR